MARHQVWNGNGNLIEDIEAEDIIGKTELEILQEKTILWKVYYLNQAQILRPSWISFSVRSLI